MSPTRRTLAVVLVALWVGSWVAGCAGDPEAGGPAPALTGERTAVPAPAATPSPQVSPAPAPSAPASSSPTVRPSGPFPADRVTLVPAPGGDPVPVAVHVAADPETRRRGLMHREDVPEGTGMLFVWPDDNTGAFWMKDTLVPLSIAFADADGRILRVLDMVPCESDPCERYDPGVAYRFALEVARGEFDRLGIAEGDRLLVPDALTGAGDGGDGG